MFITYLFAFLGCAVVSLFLTRAVRNLALRFGFVWAPESEHHTHNLPVPRLGGIAIYCTLVLAAILLLGAAHVTTFVYLPAAKQFAGVLIPAGIIFALGLYDDFRGADAKLKFTVQALAAAVLYSNGFGIPYLAFLGDHRLATLLNFSFTLLWIVGITNAFNLIDGLDGLAAGTALLSTATVFIVSLLLHNSFAALLTALLAGSILGFLRYNFAPATIFLGDSGSLLIGFLLAAVGLMTSAKAPTAVAVLLPAVAFGLPVLDVFLAILRRFLSGRRLFDADREHIHHKLITRGMTHRRAVLVLYAVSAGFGLLSLTLLYNSRFLLIVLLAILLPSLAIGVRHLRYHEAAEIERLFRNSLSHRQVIANNVRVRTAEERFQHCYTFDQLASEIREILEPIGFAGIDFHLSPAFDTLDKSTNTVVPVDDGRLQYAWDEESESYSSIGAVLTTDEGLNCGHFGAFWNANDCLQVDLHLLTSRFPTLVANALFRCWKRNEAAAKATDDAVLKLAKNGAAGDRMSDIEKSRTATA